MKVSKKQEIIVMLLLLITAGIACVLCALYNWGEYNPSAMTEHYGLNPQDVVSTLCNTNRRFKEIRQGMDRATINLWDLMIKDYPVDDQNYLTEEMLGNRKTMLEGQVK